MTLALALSYDYVANQGVYPPALSIGYHSGNVFWGVNTKISSNTYSSLAIFRSTEGLDFYDGPKQSCFELRETIPLALQAYGYTISPSTFTLTLSSGGTLRVDYLVQRATHTGTGRSTEIIWPGGFATKNRESPHGEVVCSAKSRTVISKPHPIIEYPQDNALHSLIPTVATQCQGRAISLTANNILSG